MAVIQKRGAGFVAWATAIVFWITPLFKFIDALLSEASNVDLVVSRSNDPGWIGKVYFWVTTALAGIPPWAYPIMILIGLAALQFGQRRALSRSARDAVPRKEFLTVEHPEGKAADKPLITLEAILGVEPIGNLVPSSMLRIHNNSNVTLERACLIKVENVVELKKVDKSTLLSKPLQNIPNPLILRTEGQCRDKKERRGAFTLRSGENKNVVVVWNERGSGDQIFFMHEDGSKYPLHTGQFEMKVAVYGAKVPTKKTLRLTVGPASRVQTELCAG